MKTKCCIYDWEFSTCRPCDDCGEKPDDYWQMARIEVDAEKHNMYQMKWVCMSCLGRRVTGI